MRKQGVLFWINGTKLRKAGTRRNAGPSFFATIFKIILDKQGKMCGLFANLS